MEIKRAIIITVISAFIMGVLGILINYTYAFFAFHISSNADYYRNPNTNETIIELNIYQNGFKTINGFNFIVSNDCHTFWYPSKIAEGPQNCKLETPLTGSCDKFNVKNELTLRFKSPNTLPENCTTTVSYDSDWPGLLFRLPSTASLHKTPYPLTYESGSTYIISPTTNNFSFQIVPMRNKGYYGGRFIAKAILSTNKTQKYTLTGEWFNSSTEFSTTTYLMNSSHTDSVYVLEYGPSNNYYWWEYPGWLDVGFMSTLRDADKGIHQRNASFQAIYKPDLMPYLQEDNDIKFDVNSTVFALYSIDKQNAKDDLMQATMLLDTTRNYLSVPEEISKRVYCDDNAIDSLTTFYEKEGTASEFNSLYVMFLRSVGIPAKIDHLTKNGKEYPYTSVYIEGKDWLPVDVFNKSQKFGECFINCT